MSFAEIVREQLVIPTYELEDAEKAPLFYELRNHQGTKGNIYPIPMLDKFKNKKTDRIYNAIRLENEYIRVVVLPELGGRIYEAYDKKADYHFVYKNNVIKPAMIGLAGAWISGGIEFNWPQHHRPTTFMPVDAVLEDGTDGEKTAWMGEIEPLFGTKGMIGVSIHPETAYVKVKARVYNATDKVQTFHWWANLAVHVSDDYQLKFPPDIDYITYHYKDAVSSFPQVKGEFARVDFGNEGADITWYKNIPGPASFFIFNSNNNFMGGYDHGKNRGTVHVADRHISPGKKFFTWGNGKFGDAWQKNLTDEDGPYIEIMTGCYTDNQPDFAFLQPYETKVFEQGWYALQDLPELKKANLKGAISLLVESGVAKLGFASTSMRQKARVILRRGAELLLDRTLAIGPGKPFTAEIPVSAECSLGELEAILLDEDGSELVSWREQSPYFAGKEPPQPHAPSRPPAEIFTMEELYLEGLQLEQYRHPTLDPVQYYQEGLRRDKMDAHCNNAMGQRSMKQGRYAEAEEYFHRAVKRLTARNYNPYDSEPLYHLGLARRKLGKESEALDNLRKAAWSQAWRAPALQAATELYLRQGEWQQALQCCEEALPYNAQGLGLRFLKSVALRRLARPKQAEALNLDTMAFDRLDYGARFELSLCLQAQEKITEANTVVKDLLAIIEGKPAPWLSLAGQYLDAGLWQETQEVLINCPKSPLREYYGAFVAAQMGKTDEAEKLMQQGERATMDYCFPWHDRELEILSFAVSYNPVGGHAPYYLGLAYYGRSNTDQAIKYWEEAIRRDPELYAAHRCLAMAYYDKRGDITAALREMEVAFSGNRDARYLFELIQLLKVTGASVRQRLTLLEKHSDLTKQRDDLYTAYVALLNQCGELNTAAKRLREHIFHPYEGGEGVLVRQHILTYLLLGREAMKGEKAETALECYNTALQYPENYNEGPKYRVREGHVYYHIAAAWEVIGNYGEREHWLLAVVGESFDLDEATFYQGLAWRKLKNDSMAQAVFHRMLEVATELLSQQGHKYFTGFPVGLPFEQDIGNADRVKAHTARFYAYSGLGQHIMAEQELSVLEKLHAVTPWAEIIRSDSN